MCGRDIERKTSSEDGEAGTGRGTGRVSGDAIGTGQGTARDGRRSAHGPGDGSRRGGDLRLGVDTGGSRRKAGGESSAGGAGKGKTGDCEACWKATAWAVPWRYKGRINSDARSLFRPQRGCFEWVTTHVADPTPKGDQTQRRPSSRFRSATQWRRFQQTNPSSAARVTPTLCPVTRHAPPRPALPYQAVTRARSPRRAGTTAHGGHICQGRGEGQDQKTAPAHAETGALVSSPASQSRSPISDRALLPPSPVRFGSFPTRHPATPCPPFVPCPLPSCIWPVRRSVHRNTDCERSWRLETYTVLASSGILTSTVVANVGRSLGCRKHEPGGRDLIS